MPNCIVTEIANLPELTSDDCNITNIAVYFLLFFHRYTLPIVPSFCWLLVGYCSPNEAYL